MINKYKIATFELIPYGIALFDKNHNIISYNKYFDLIFLLSKNKTNADFKSVELKYINTNKPKIKHLSTGKIIEYSFKILDSNNYIMFVLDVTENFLQDQDLYYKANYDQLTGIPNRSLFEDRFNQAITISKRQNTKIAILFIDLDDFKYINDTYGHEAGDKVLITVSKRLLKYLRESDTVSRWAGDEFVIMLSDVKSIINISDLCERILKELNKKITYSKKNISLSVSIGISIYPDSSKSYLELIKNADRAMYKAKNSGKNKFIFYD